LGYQKFNYRGRCGFAGLPVSEEALQAAAFPPVAEPSSTQHGSYGRHPRPKAKAKTKQNQTKLVAGGWREREEAVPSL
jgi:hypothetical protein